MSSYVTPKTSSDSAILEEDEVRYIENRDPNRPLSRYNKIELLLTKSDKNNDIPSYPVQASWEPPTIPVLPQDRYVEVLPEWQHRPDLISLEFYGNEQLYWVIAYANEMVDPFAETYVGRRLRIPDRENLFHEVLAK